MAETIKLRTNVAMFGVARAAYYQQGKEFFDKETGETSRWKDQVVLYGNWGEDPVKPGDGAVYLPISLVGQMQSIGLLEQTSDRNEKGVPEYKILDTKRQLRVIKCEDLKDAKKKRAYIGWADAGHPETAAAAPEAPKATGPRPAGVNGGTGRASPAEPTAPTAARPAQPDEEKLERLRKAHRRRLAQIAETTACAWRAAKHEVDLFLAEIGVERPKLPSAIYFDMVARFAATVAIAADREDLDVTRKPKDGRSGVAQEATEPPPVPPVPITDEDSHTGEKVSAIRAKSEFRDDDGLWPEEGDDEGDLPF